MPNDRRHIYENVEISRLDRFFTSTQVLICVKYYYNLN